MCTDRQVKYWFALITFFLHRMADTECQNVPEGLANEHSVGETAIDGPSESNSLSQSEVDLQLRTDSDAANTSEHEHPCKGSTAPFISPETHSSGGVTVGNAQTLGDDIATLIEPPTDDSVDAQTAADVTKEPHTDGSADIEAADTTGADLACTNAGVAGPPVSKRQQKKLLRFEKKKDFLRQKRAEEREKRKGKRKLRLEEAADSSDPLPPSRKQLKHNVMAQSSNHVRVAVDMSFDHMMIDKDISSCIQQLCFSYAANRRSSAPLQFHIVGFSGKSRELFDSQQDRRGWDVNVSREPYTSVFDPSAVVYLSSESENVLETLDDAKVYVIGGLVDRNAHKGLCHRLAVQAGVAHARLPIDEYLEMKTRKVLTVNHVFEILLRFTECHDWRQAFWAVIPKRKGPEDK